jgi:hypothetical protein
VRTLHFTNPVLRLAARCDEVGVGHGGRQIHASFCDRARFPWIGAGWPLCSARAAFALVWRSGVEQLAGGSSAVAAWPRQATV